MQRKTKALCIHVLFLCYCISTWSGIGLAQQQGALYTGDPDNITITDPQSNMNTNGQPAVFTSEEMKNMDLLFQQYQEEIINGWESKTLFKQAQQIKLNRDLSKNLEVFSDSDQKIQEYTEKLQPLEQKIQTLKEQLAFLEEQTALTQYKITNVTEQLITKQEEMRNLMEDVDRATVEVKNQEKILIEYVKLIYDQKQQYYDFNDKTVSDLKLLMADDPISKTITKGEYVSIVQKTGQNILDKLKKVYEQLAGKEVEMETNQSRLQLLQAELTRQKTSLQEEETAKQLLLETTQGDEQKYRDLLEQAQREKLRSAEDIALLKNNVELINKELEALRKNTSNVDAETLNKKAESASNLLEATVPEVTSTRIAWPVNPTRGLSAYFHDENYINVFGVDHGAIDIPTPQGTEIRTPADALVHKAKDNGYGYSYIILAHRNGFLTVYGHVSKLLVKEGELVRKEDIIGLSGGAPGTFGAGWRTTGPHLHFEVWKEGKRVDPLIYMDVTKLDKVPKSKIPEQEDAILD